MYPVVTHGRERLQGFCLRRKISVCPESLSDSRKTGTMQSRVIAEERSPVLQAGHILVSKSSHNTNTTAPREHIPWPGQNRRS